MRRSWRVVFINIHGRRTLLNSDPGISCKLKTPAAEGRAEVVRAWANGPVLTHSGRGRVWGLIRLTSRASSLSEGKRTVNVTTMDAGFDTAQAYRLLAAKCMPLQSMR